jgi:hypothetical protein
VGGGMQQKNVETFPALDTGEYGLLLEIVCHTQKAMNVHGLVWTARSWEILPEEMITSIWSIWSFASTWFYIE